MSKLALDAQGSYSQSRKRCFKANVLFSPSDSQFENDENDVLYMNLGPLKTGTKVSLPGIIDNYDCYRVQASDNGVVEVAAGSGETHSMFGLTSQRISSSNFCFFSFEFSVQQLSRQFDAQ